MCRSNSFDLFQKPGSKAPEVLTSNWLRVASLPDVTQ
jgi:hypothetical protein